MQYPLPMSFEQEALQLSRPEKLRLMEVLWADMTREGDALEVPAWHEAALRETEAGLAEGTVQAVDWEEAKLRLSRRESGSSFLPPPSATCKRVATSTKAKSGE